MPHGRENKTEPLSTARRSQVLLIFRTSGGWFKLVFQPGFLFHFEPKGRRESQTLSRPSGLFRSTSGGRPCGPGQPQARPGIEGFQPRRTQSSVPTIAPNCVYFRRGLSFVDSSDAMRLAPSSKFGSIFGGAQPSRLWFGAPSRRTQMRQASRDSGMISRAPANREGAIHSTREGYAPLSYFDCRMS
jgi:hypothetical protein